MDRSISLLFLDVCSILLLILVAFFLASSPSIPSLRLRIIEKLIDALSVLFARTASFGDAAGENFLTFASGLARRWGIRTVVVRSGFCVSRRVWSVIIFEDELRL